MVQVVPSEARTAAPVGCFSASSILVPFGSGAISAAVIGIAAADVYPSAVNVAGSNSRSFASDHMWYLPALEKMVPSRGASGVPTGYVAIAWAVAATPSLERNHEFLTALLGTS